MIQTSRVMFNKYYAQSEMYTRLKILTCQFIVSEIHHLIVNYSVYQYNNGKSKNRIDP